MFGRFTYAANNPFRFVDPDGRKEEEKHDQRSICRTKSCDTASVGGSSVARTGASSKSSSGGQAWISSRKDAFDYDPMDDSWHEYSSTSIVCYAEWACSPAEMADYLSRFGFPGQDPTVPLVDGAISVVKDPVFDHAMGRVVTSMSPDGLALVNVTLPRHVLANGEIRRYVYESHGAWYATTNGIGNNIVPGGRLANQLFGPLIFEGVDYNMRSYIREAKGK